MKNYIPGLVLLSVIMATAAYNVLVSWYAVAEKKEEILTQLPKIGREKKYVSSDTCRACHPGEYTSWHRTYHRTMTQVAHSENIYGEFDGTRIKSHGMEYTVFSINHEYWVRMPDPDLVMAAAREAEPGAYGLIPHVDRRVVMATGSHHYQTYWVESPRLEKLMQTVPLVYLIRDRQWIPREDAFMRHPGDKDDFITQWNHHCIRCHSTGGNPGLQPPGSAKAGQLISEVGEMGISCEACHGPGEEHIQFHTNPLNRYKSRNQGHLYDAIISPEKLSHKRSSEVCGQCHGVYIDAGIEEENYRYEGSTYKPGEDIHQYRYYIQHPENTGSEVHWEEYVKNPEFYSERWWEDGSILAGGREYTAMSVSGCYVRGEISCMSCHKMHESDPVDQLNPKLSEQQMCVQCHTDSKYTSDVALHTHHEPGSSGSECMNCHMPRTAYALFGALRSHQISSPNIKSIVQHNVPNACNLCHLDRTISWTIENLKARYNLNNTSDDLPLGADGVAASIYWLLQGDAKRRAISAWHMGWPEAHFVSGNEWIAPFLALTLRDAYGVVRYIAKESIRTLPDMKEFHFNFLADIQERNMKSEEVLKTWLSIDKLIEVRGNPTELLVKPDRKMNQSRIREMLKNRDNRPVSISE